MNSLRFRSLRNMDGNVNLHTALNFSDSRRSQQENLFVMFFTAADYDFTFKVQFHRRIPATGAVVSSVKRRRALKLVDRALSKRQYKSALSLVKQLQGKPDGLRAFGAAKQITKRISPMDEPELNRKEFVSLQPLVDSILDSIQRCLQISFLEKIDSFKILRENADIRKFHIRADKGRISSKTLNQFSCVILGGLVAELLVAGNSDGHLADILKLESVVRWLGLPKSEADLHLKWAATNTAFIMSRHCETRSRLAEAMALGKPIGFCIDTIENCLQGEEV